MKDMINCGGENVYCVEAENALAGAPGVFEAAMLGVPDEVMGEKVGAVTAPVPGAAFDVTAVLDYLEGERRRDLQNADNSAVTLPGRGAEGLAHHCP
jgi:acyl-CoA synthetase (AMP-forming)/AMP-acid ligase II